MKLSALEEQLLNAIKKARKCRYNGETAIARHWNSGLPGNTKSRAVNAARPL